MLHYGVSLIVLILVLGGGLLALYETHQRALLQQRLSTELGQLLSEVIITPTQPGFNPGLTQRTGSYLLQDNSGIFVRLLGTEGQIYDQSANFAGQDPLITPLPTNPEGIAEVDAFWADAPIRSLYAPVKTDTTALIGWIEVTSYRWDAAAFLRAELARLSLGLLIAILVAGGIGYGLARRALKPMTALTNALQGIHAKDLGMRLPQDHYVHDELTQLASTFNALFARLEAAFSRERRFISNAAHQLLNPLSNMRSVTEVTLRRIRDVSAYQDTLQHILRNIRRVTLTVEQLLQLSRAEALTQQPLDKVDFSTLCQHEVRHLHTRAATQEIQVITTIAPNLQVTGHAANLEAAVTNLLDNALKYTPPQGTIKLTLNRYLDSAHLQVSDTGIGFSEAEKEHLFERFFRSKNPSVQQHTGSGLGLAIVQSIVHHYDGVLQAHSDGLDQGATFEIFLPLAADAPTSRLHPTQVLSNVTTSVS